MIVINPMPDVFEGVLLPFQQGDLSRVVQSAVGGDLGVKYISIAKVKTSIGEQFVSCKRYIYWPQVSYIRKI